MVRRDTAYEEYKDNKNPDNLRYYKNLKNEVNQMICKERYVQKSKLYSEENTTPKEKWQAIKKDTGQKKHETPEIIIEGGIHHTHPQKMAQALNRQYVTKIRKMVDSIPPTDTNPLQLYEKVIGDQTNSLSFTFQQINPQSIIKRS